MNNVILALTFISFLAGSSKLNSLKPDDISEMSSNNDQQQQQQQLEYNKKWKSYILICVTSLTNFVSIGETFDQSHSNYVGSNPKVNYMFGVVSTTHHILLQYFLASLIANKT